MQLREVRRFDRGIVQHAGGVNDTVEWAVRMEDFRKTCCVGHVARHRDDVRTARSDGFDRRPARLVWLRAIQQYKRGVFCVRRDRPCQLEADTALPTGDQVAATGLQPALRGRRHHRRGEGAACPIDVQHALGCLPELVDDRGRGRLGHQHRPQSTLRMFLRGDPHQTDDCWVAADKHRTGCGRTLNCVERVGGVAS